MSMAPCGGRRRHPDMESQACLCYPYRIHTTPDASSHELLQPLRRNGHA
jgi:hypothetical protein